MPIGTPLSRKVSLVTPLVRLTRLLELLCSF
nr:MAG TPA: hypothetical protein [Caudoviricetes sp.]